jgi:hypothetical protein
MMFDLPGFLGQVEPNEEDLPKRNGIRGMSRTTPIAIDVPRQEVCRSE